uniref:Uncharacterized protein n=1 Tax=Rhizophora mucronata TaxID=61149 RepID=A0A2P2PDP7_RHIMU
MAVIKMKTLR